MAKRWIVPFGESKTDQLIKEFLARKGIDPADVLRCTIERAVDHSEIALVFIFDDDPADIQDKE